jgi:hypothetical protein
MVMAPNDETIYQIEFLRYGEFCIIIPSLPENETIYEGNEYILNGKKITIHNIIMNDEETNCFIEDLDGPFIYYVDDDNNIYKDCVSDFIYKLKNNGEIVVSMHEEYVEHNHLLQNNPTFTGNISINSVNRRLEF